VSVVGIFRLLERRFQIWLHESKVSSRNDMPMVARLVEWISGNPEVRAEQRVVQEG
jgi:hypothetical protein